MDELDQNTKTMPTEFSLWLDKHDKELLTLRLSGIGYDESIVIMVEKYIKENQNAL